MLKIIIQNNEVNVYFVGQVTCNNSQVRKCCYSNLLCSKPSQFHFSVVPRDQKAPTSQGLQKKLCKLHLILACGLSSLTPCQITHKDGDATQHGCNLGGPGRVQNVQMQPTLESGNYFVHTHNLGWVSKFFPHPTYVEILGFLGRISFYLGFRIAWKSKKSTEVNKITEKSYHYYLEKNLRMMVVVKEEGVFKEETTPYVLVYLWKVPLFLPSERENQGF